MMKPYTIGLWQTIAIICFSTLGLNTAQAQWTRKADEIHKRAECNNVVYNNKLYVFSGFGDNPIIEKTNEVYDIAANKWSVIAPLPAGREVTHQGIVLVDDNVWIIGGRAVDAHGPASSKVSIYNITTNTWSTGPEIIDPATGSPFPLGAGGYALLGRTIHIFGGFGPTLCADQSKLHLTIDVDKYMADRSHTTWENKLAPMPIPRNHISYVVLGGKIYAFGGQFQHDCGAVDQVYCHMYNPATNTWTRLADLPKPRSHAEAATFAVDGKIFLTAGQGFNNLTQNTVYQYTPQTNGPGSWTNNTAYQLPGSFLGLSAKLAGKYFIITNGALNSYSNERKETYIANVNRSTARTLGFSNACFSPDLDSSHHATVRNLLYVIEDASSYNIESDVSWLTVSKNDHGTVSLNGVDVQVNIDAAGLSPGAHTGKITATSSTGSKASFCVNINVTDTGTPSGYTLALHTNGSGSISKTPNRSNFEPGTEVKLNATAASGWHFTAWSGDTVSTTNPLYLTIDTNRSVTATFEKDSTTTPPPDEPLISNVKSTAPGSYQLSTLHTGVVYYTDRDYVITTVPSVLSDAPFIKTACNDKTSKASSQVTFNLAYDATIYVAYDPRATALPGWLSGWKKLSDKLGINDAKISSFNLYSKDFNAGTVSLGGNMANPSAGALSQYLVIGVAKTNNNNTLAKTSALSAPVTINSAMAKTQNNSSPAVAVAKPILYPNPAHGNLQVIFPEAYKYKKAAIVRVVSLNGDVRNVSNAFFNSAGSTVDVNIAPLSLKRGTYLLHVTSVEGRVDILKFMVQ
ncbi:MAG: kelch repeat-containing protein [Mucilaginibacter sp.]|uniref:Kelch repeat-containing protein n=1 Tax=Mucilaginibacter sp. TaxID=1882438 RepID=UPI0031A08991